MIARAIGRQGRPVLRSLAACRAGVAALELALILPVAVLVFAGCADYGLMVRNANALQTAARAGAAYAAEYSSDVAGITQAAGSAAALDATTLAVAATNFCGCSDGGAAACSAACPDGGPTRSYVSVSVTQPYTPVTPFAGLVLPPALTAQVTLRTK